MWKAFAEMEAIGLIGPERPQMIAVQAEGCQPIVRAFERGERHAERWENAETVAMGIRVPAALGDFLILDAVRESGGYAAAVPDSEIGEAQADMARKEGLLLCPEGAAAYAAWKRAIAEGRLAAGARLGRLQLRHRPQIPDARHGAPPGPDAADRLDRPPRLKRRKR